MIREISGAMTIKEMEKAIDILVESATFEELEGGGFEAIVIDKLVTVIHSAMISQGEIQVAY